MLTGSMDRDMIESLSDSEEEADSTESKQHFSRMMDEAMRGQ